MRIRLGLFASFWLVCGASLVAGVHPAIASDSISGDLAQALAKTGTQLGSPIMIRVVKRTQAEFDEHPPDLHDSCGPRHPVPLPTERTDYNSDTFGYTKWEHSKKYGSNNEMDVGLGEVQVWIRSDSGQYVLLNSFEPGAFSGSLGPKTRAGDGQTPEGFYDITQNRMKPHSQYVEAMDIGYPNTYDKAHHATGSLIEIHGNIKTMGCIAMGAPVGQNGVDNTQIKDIFSLVNAAQKDGQAKVPVEIFPFPMTDANLKKIPDSSSCVANLKNFWKKLQPAYTDFDQNHLPPTISYAPNGDYVVNGPLPDMGAVERMKSLGTDGCPSCPTR